LPNVNAVPFNVTTPLVAPSTVNNSTADANNANVPSTVTAAPTGTAAPEATFITAELATVIPVDANRPLPLNVNVPSFTDVVPVYVFTPLSVRAPPLTFTNEPETEPSDITPEKFPLLKVNAVPFKFTIPPAPPDKLDNVAELAANAKLPSTVTAAPLDNAAPLPTETVAPASIVRDAEPKRPEPERTKVPDRTAVAPV
jgi:hypothetical protein